MSSLLNRLAVVLVMGIMGSMGAYGQIGSPLATTSFTRQLLTNTTAADARAKLGFLSTNMTSITNYDGNGASVTNLNASQLTSGTVPDARFPATLPAASGANLTALNGTQITSGTVPLARLPGPVLTNNFAGTITATAFVGDGSGLTGITGGGGGSGAVSLGNTVWVDAVNGNDATGARGRADRPFANPRTAALTAVAGDTVVVLPGNYFTNNLLMPGVNYYFYPGASVIHYINSTNSVGSALEWGIFDDRPCGATTNVIGGNGNFILLGYSNTIGVLAQRINTNALGTITITNNLSRVTIKAHNVGRSKWLDSGVAACCVQVNDGFLSIDADLFYDPHEGQGTINITNLSPLVTLTRQSISAGLIWMVGQVYAHVSENRPFRTYGIWGEGVATNDVTDLWYTGDIMTGKIYIAADSVNYRSWVRLKALEIAETQPAGAQEQAASYFGNGKHYLIAEKIAAKASGSQSAIDTAPGTLGTSNTLVWVTAQKITSSNSWINVSSGRVEAQVVQFEDLGGVGLGTGGGGLNTANNGVLHVQCNMPVYVTNGPAARHSGLEMRLTGMTLNTANTDSATNRPVYAAAAGLILKDCALVAPTSAEAIGASSAQTVAINGACMSTKTNSPNITLGPLGSFTVDTRVK